MKILTPSSAEVDRPDLSIDAPVTERLLTAFLVNEVGRAGFERVVLGLSGGLDSALVAYLAARALGPSAVHAVLLPYRSSSPRSTEDALRVVDALGIGSETVDISAIVDGFVEAAGAPDKVRLGNVMARARMTVLFDRSMERASLVLGTSNKTELLLGYGTWYGDLASAVNPIGDLYKAQVRSLARHVGVPDPILEKPPSADLWPDQTDEQDLGFGYDEVDPILAMLVDARMSIEAASRLAPRELVERVARRVVATQFKRRMPVIAKVSTRSIGWDFRYPRDWKT